MKGTLITFEGIDFSGKSLQANLLKEHLLAKKLPVLFFREPGGTEISEKIREVLLDIGNCVMTPATEVLLYSAARAQMVAEGIRPHLQKSGIVICDRFYDSTTAYQGYGRQIDLNFINELNTFVTGGLKPDRTFLIDLAPETALRRSQKTGHDLDRLESETLEFHRRVRAGYLAVAQQETERFVVLDGTKSVEDLKKEIIAQVEQKLHL